MSLHIALNTNSMGLLIALFTYSMGFCVVQSHIAYMNIRTKCRTNGGKVAGAIWKKFPQGKSIGKSDIP